MDKSLAQQRVTQALEASPGLMDAAIVEPRITNLLTVAATQENPDAHWRIYEALKAVGTHLVGWEAEHPALRTSELYEALMRAIDLLLPVSAPKKAETPDDDWDEFDEFESM